MTKTIAFTGKGGVGKTTCLVLFLKFLIENKESSRILVIDADPDSNIADLVGFNVNFKDTIAGKMRILPLIRLISKPSKPKFLIVFCMRINLTWLRWVELRGAVVIVMLIMY
jgi:CO dehydrogenase nickel-insertion accessory protein CooC1